MNDYKLFPAFLVVFILLIPIVIAPPSGETSITISSGDTGGNLGATTSLKANGASCSAASECTGGYCNSGVCASSAPSGGGGPSGGTSGTTTTTTTTTPAPTPTPTPEAPKPTAITSVSVPVTETKAVEEIASAIKPADLGVTEIKAENVQVTKTGIAEVVTTTQATILQQTVESVLPTVTDESAKQVLNEIKQAISSGSSAPVSVSSTVEVFEVKEKTTNKTAFASKISLTFKANKDLQDVNIVEVIPKTVAASIADVLFLGNQPKVLQADPIVQWIFPEVKEGETKYLSYQVAKKIETLETKTIATAEVVKVPTPLPPEEEKPSIVPYVIIGLVVLVAVGYFVYKQMKRKP